MRLLLILLVWLSSTSGLASSAAEQPTLVVRAPENGGLVQGLDVVVDFEIRDFTLVPSDVPLDEAGKRPEANRPGEGHLHFMLDLQPVVVWERGEPYTFSNVPPGEHVLMVELVNNDHSSLSPPVMQHLRFRNGLMLPSSGSEAGMLARDGWSFLLLAVALAACLVGLFLQRRHIR